jgi:hypothetical protein
VSPLDRPVTNCLAARFHLYAAEANRRSLCCMTTGEIVVIAVAIILAIAILIGAVFFARRLDRDEPGPTVYDPDLYRGHNWYG